MILFFRMVLFLWLRRSKDPQLHLLQNLDMNHSNSLFAIVCHLLMQKKGDFSRSLYFYGICTILIALIYTMVVPSCLMRYERKGWGIFCVCMNQSNSSKGIKLAKTKIQLIYLTGIARLIHVFDLNLTTQNFIFPCGTCSVSTMKQFGYPPKINICLMLDTPNDPSKVMTFSAVVNNAGNAS